METLVPYAIWLVIGLVGLSLVAVVLFGLRNLTYGKANLLTLAFMSLPVVIIVALGFSTGDWSYAGIMTFMIMLVVTAVSLLLSGIRGLIGL